MVLADLRNHGKSAELKDLIPPHDIPNAANDLANLVKSQGWNWPDVVIGHSMGGKVALQYAQSCARGDYGDSVKLPKQVLLLALSLKAKCATKLEVVSIVYIFARRLNTKVSSIQADKTSMFK